jgi:uncharacterized protein (DUF1499 family)
VNNAILDKPELVRAFQKARIKETQRGFVVSEMIDGTKILEDENYLTADVKNQIFKLINDCKLTIEVETEELRRRVFTSELASA